MPIGPKCGDQLGHINQATDFLGNSTWVVCGENTIKLFNGQEFIDVGDNLRSIEPKFANLDPTLWSSCQIGQVVFLNHPQLYPLYWVNDGGNVDLKPLWWTSTRRRGRTRAPMCYLCAHKNFLLPLVWEGGHLADKVWWSHPAGPTVLVEADMGGAQQYRRMG